MDDIDKIIGNILPNIKDMELIQQYGLTTWIIVLAIKVFFLIAVVWFMFGYLGLELRFGRKKR